MDGIVIKSTGSWYDVRTADNRVFKCSTRGKFKWKGIKVTNPVAVGDRVRFNLETEKQGIVHHIEPRKNYLIRRSTRKTKLAHILACNIDMAILTATFTLPKTSMGFIDRFLTAAESFRIPSLLVFNKSDLWDTDTRASFDKIKKVYDNIGIDVMSLSAVTKENLERFREIISGKVSLLAGHSGVGKTSMLNQLSGKAKRKTAQVSTFSRKGTHTTTYAEMLELDEETNIIDTPGIKELGLIDIYDEEISHFFPEMRRLFGQCKFYNCTHLHEPHCAVIEAVERGEIAEFRYASYVSMVKEEDTHR